MKNMQICILIKKNPNVQIWATTSEQRVVESLNSLFELHWVKINHFIGKVLPCGKCLFKSFMHAIANKFIFTFELVNGRRNHLVILCSTTYYKLYKLNSHSLVFISINLKFSTQFVTRFFNKKKRTKIISSEKSFYIQFNSFVIFYWFLKHSRHFSLSNQFLVMKIFRLS